MLFYHLVYLNIEIELTRYMVVCINCKVFVIRGVSFYFLGRVLDWREASSKSLLACLTVLFEFLQVIYMVYVSSYFCFLTYPVTEFEV